jgi:GxxExxY protein
MRRDLLEADRVHSIVGAFYDVYNFYGPGLSEALYSASLELELTDRGHHVLRELTIPVYYKRDRYVGRQRLDMVVDSKVIVENKASERLPRGTCAQLISYLEASPFQVGLLLPFGPQPRFTRFIDFPKRPRGQPHS